jgi:hypothetical protein
VQERQRGEKALLLRLSVSRAHASDARAASLNQLVGFSIA